MWKQICNIALIYLIQSFVYIALNVIFQRFLQTSNVLTIHNFYTFLIKPVAHFWYLYALFLIYLIEILLKKFFQNSCIRLGISLILAAIGYFTDLGIISKAFYELLYFEMGHQIDKKKQVPYWFCIAGLAFSIVRPVFSIKSNVFNMLSTIFIATTVSMLIIKLCSDKLDRHYKKFTALGASCIWIYIFHTYFTSVSRSICSRMIENLPECTFIIVTVAGVIGPLVVMYVFKKLKTDKIVTKPISYIWRKNG